MAGKALVGTAPTAPRRGSTDGFVTPVGMCGFSVLISQLTSPGAELFPFEAARPRNLVADRDSQWRSGTASSQLRHTRTVARSPSQMRVFIMRRSTLRLSNCTVKNRFMNRTDLIPLTSLPTIV